MTGPTHLPLPLSVAHVSWKMLYPETLCDHSHPWSQTASPAASFACIRAGVKWVNAMHLSRRVQKGKEARLLHKLPAYPEA